MNASAVERPFPASPESVTRITAFVADYAKAFRLNADAVSRLEVAIEEVAVNISSHAYGGEPGEIRVRLRPEVDRLEIDVEDDGPAFDPLKQEMPNTALGLDDRRLGGLGVLLVREFTDDVRYRRDAEQNVLTLVVKVP